MSARTMAKQIADAYLLAQAVAQGLSQSQKALPEGLCLSQVRAAAEARIEP